MIRKNSKFLPLQGGSFEVYTPVFLFGYLSKKLFACCNLSMIDFAMHQADELVFSYWTIFNMFKY